MIDYKVLDKICNQLESTYADFGKLAATNLRHWLLDDVPFAFPEMIARHLDQNHLDLVFDAFWQTLPFGTGGRRGRVGYGPNRVNPTTVGMTVQGHCHYLKKTFSNKNELMVVVANDVRIFRDNAGIYGFLGDNHPLIGESSRTLGKLACEIYAANGITAYFAQPNHQDGLLSTPELSFLISRLKAVGGINLSASHNPPDDNGIKVYDDAGSQPVSPNDQKLVDTMNQVTNIQRVDFSKAVADGKIKDIPGELHQVYIDIYLRLYDNIYSPRPDIKIVYTPLCGCGGTTVGDVLKELKFPLIIPPDQERPDGGFSMIPFKAPNPEVPQATDPAKKFADDEGAGIVLCSDPDADRVGVDIKLEDGSWYHMDGNQIATILCYFLMLDAKGPKLQGLLIETLVTTRILRKIVEKAGNSWLIDDLLVGFKYIANVLKSLELNGKYNDISCSVHDLVLAVEESHGVLQVEDIRDKDATPACMYLAALYQRLYKDGKTLLDYYTDILGELGGYDCINRSIFMSGADGMLKKDKIMSSLRTIAPSSIGGYKVEYPIVDYWDHEKFGPFVSETDKTPRNVIQIFTSSFTVVVRPSGTEPKLKFYVLLTPEGVESQKQGMELLAEIRKKAQNIADRVYNELLQKIDPPQKSEYTLSDASLMLPDIIELDKKLKFEKQTIKHLKASLNSEDFGKLDNLLSWLRAESAEMTPGSDPTPALKKPIACLCQEWKEELGSNTMLLQLERWAIK